MNFVKDLIGGIVIIVAAGAIAVAQNAFRGDGIPLVPGAPKPSVGQQEVSASGFEKTVSSSENTLSTPDNTASAPPASAAESVDGAAPSGEPTAEEIASGVVSKDRVREFIRSAGVVFIDARAPQEYEAGHIPGAINVPAENLTDYYDKLTSAVPLDAVVVCYCRSVTCDQSDNLAREMRFMGYKTVMVYKGGWEEWSQTENSSEGSPQRD